jgi:hypothetical protein
VPETFLSARCFSRQVVNHWILLIGSGTL